MSSFNEPMRKLIPVFMVTLAAVQISGATGENDADYPVGYRSWQHVRTAVIQPGHPLEAQFGGIHHIYANAGAMTGLSTGEYPAGAMFVFDLLSYTEADNLIEEGGRKRLDVMQFDRKRFPETGGWAFASFVGDTSDRVNQDTTEACFGCHTSAAASNHVFSAYRP